MCCCLFLPAPRERIPKERTIRGGRTPHFFKFDQRSTDRSRQEPKMALNLQFLWRLGPVFSSFSKEITSCRTTNRKMTPNGSENPSKVEAKHRFKLIWAYFCMFLRCFSRPAGRGGPWEGGKGGGLRPPFLQVLLNVRPRGRRIYETTAIYILFRTPR